jgi:hypothetical protein
MREPCDALRGRLAQVQGSRPDPDGEIVVVCHVAAEPSRAAIEGLAGALPVALLLLRLGLSAEWDIGVGDVVLEAVARYLADTLLPLLTESRIAGTLAEGARGPGAGGVDFTLGELVTDLGVLPSQLGEGTLQAVALGTALARVAQLPSKAVGLRDHGVELAIGCLQGARQMRALDRVWVLFASEASACLRQIVNAPGDLFALGGERDRACVEVLDALQLPRGQRPDLGTQSLDAACQLAQALCARDRWDGLRACGRLLLTRFSWAARCAGRLGVVGSAGAGELLDREILVVALKHPAGNAGEQLASVGRRSLVCGCELAALLGVRSS